MQEYDINYFENGIKTKISLYENYRWIPELTIPFCATLIEQLVIKEDDTILDFGCAKGYMVKAFRLLHRKAYGVDISEYAINSAPDDIKEYVFLINSIEKYQTFISHNNDIYNWVICKDVLEHIEYEKIDNVIKTLNIIGMNVFCSIPLGDGEKYIITSHEEDVTHIIRESLEWWKDKFEKNGFKVKKAKYLMKHVKQDWIEWEKGNGFFVLENNKRT